jgi:hypothetical protein
MNINNLKIDFNLSKSSWEVKSPFGEILECFEQEFDAHEWSKQNYDYL